MISVVSYEQNRLKQSLFFHLYIPSKMELCFRKSGKTVWNHLWLEVAFLLLRFQGETKSKVHLWLLSSLWWSSFVRTRKLSSATLTCSVVYPALMHSWRMTERSSTFLTTQVRQEPVLMLVGLFSSNWACLCGNSFLPRLTAGGSCWLALNFLLHFHQSVSAGLTGP